MIVRGTSEIVIVNQHDHAQLSGDVARHFRKEFFPSEQLYEETIRAVYQHDRSWIGLDETPIWNDRHTGPMSFVAYPLIPKLTFYQKGLDETEKMNPYAALLCSMHYTSFFGQEMHPEERKFLEEETTRQQKIKASYPDVAQSLIDHHFQLLQLCDNISLYVCLNEPGVNKAQEIAWFKDGFSRSEAFNAENEQKLKPAWIDEKHIRIYPFPFAQEFTATLKCRKVLTQDMEALGIKKACEKADFYQQQIIFCQ